MTYFETIEECEQTNIFEFLEPQEPQEPQEQSVIKIGELAKININNCDEEAKNYFKYYYPHVINKVGTIVDEKKLHDKTLYLFEVLGERHWVYETELMVL